ncbi:hypothetical protein HYU08_03500 [Candidatus Woesearchaeota archaeon]|nr:hypothetical protein [Candidatus Woesearchaeota archaeon]
MLVGKDGRIISFQLFKKRGDRSFMSKSTAKKISFKGQAKCKKLGDFFTEEEKKEEKD